MLAIALFALKNWRATLALLALIALIGAGVAYRRELLATGGQAALKKVEDANAQSESLAAKAAQTVEACDAARGAWDRDAGKCVPADPAGR